MAEISVECLRREVVSGSHTYPLYVGFISASDVDKIADAPSFEDATSNHDIAKNVVGSPVKDWQRPISISRVAQIKETFDGSGELMPNPVLLARNAFWKGQIAITPKTVGPSGLPTGSFVVKVPNVGSGGAGPKPLWILDGQHRIKGLAGSKQAANAMPVVLLLDFDANVYSGTILAKLFAQVTTKATQLDELHNEWLTYGFRLGDFALGAKNEAENRKGFEVALEMCQNQQLSTVANPFFDGVRFNGQVPAQASQGGFSYTCKEIRTMVAKHYYLQKHEGDLLAPKEVAEQFALAYTALWRLVQDHSDSVFFGAKPKAQSIMQDAFMIGVLKRLLSVGDATDWDVLLKVLKFDTTDWDFDAWVQEGGLSGPGSSASKKVAVSAMERFLVNGKLDEGIEDIADYLKGDGASVEFKFTEVNKDGKPANGKAASSSIILQSGSQKNKSMQKNPYIKLLRKSANVGKLLLWDGKAQSPTEVSELKKGWVIPAERLPMKVRIEMRHYGGNVTSASLDLKK